jgi:hypothetical protein
LVWEIVLFYQLLKKRVFLQGPEIITETTFHPPGILQNQDNQGTDPKCQQSLICSKYVDNSTRGLLKQDLDHLYVRSVYRILIEQLVLFNILEDHTLW